MKKTTKIIFGSALVASVALLPSIAFSQQIPSTAQTGNIQSNLNKEMAPPTVIAPSDAPLTEDVQAPKGADKIMFVLKKMDVTGAQQMPAKDIEALYGDLVGKKISLVDVYAIANKITRLYRDNGYILSRAIVPQQEIKNGVVHIQVVEGHVSSYVLQGDAHGNDKLIRAYAEKLVNLGTLKSSNLERYLLLMNDLPGIKVRSVLAPSANVAGGAEMTLVVEHNLYQAEVGADNYGNTYLGAERLSFNGQVNSPFKSTDQITGGAVWAPDGNELVYFNGGFKHNVGTEGTKVGLAASYTGTQPGLTGALAAIDTRGTALSTSLTVDHPFVRSRRFNVLGGASFDFTKNKTLFAPGLGAIETNDLQRIARVNGRVTYLDGFSGYNEFATTVSKGLEVLGSSRKWDTHLSRASGDPAFIKIGADVSRLQRIPSTPLSVALAFTGQYSAQPLLASEEFSFGGSDFGRGFDASEITGDQGLAGKAELIYTNAIHKTYLDEYQAYGFFDQGIVWNKDPAVGQDPRESGASAGIGSRFKFTQRLNGDIFVAKPLTRNVPSRGNDGSDWTFKFALKAGF